MRKRIIGRGLRDVAAAEPNWIDIDRLAQVEITSEDVDHPIESALIPGTSSGWRAAQPGEQTIRLLFDEPLRLRLIHLTFHEDEQERTQETLVEKRRKDKSFGKMVKRVVAEKQKHKG